MKSNEFAKFLRDFDALLGTETDQNFSLSLNAFQKFFLSAGTKQVNAALKLLNSENFPDASYFNSKIGSLIHRLKILQGFARAYNKKAIGDDVGRLVKFCELHAEADVTSFTEIALASLDKQKKKPTRALKVPSANDAAINAYLRRLDETFGFEPDFDLVFDELKADKSMKAAQLKKLAKLFTKLSAKSAPDALNSIYRRHSNILDADKHKIAVDGQVR